MSNIQVPSSQDTAPSSNSAEPSQPTPAASAEPVNGSPGSAVTRAQLEKLDEILHNPAVANELAAQGNTIDLQAVETAIESSLADIDQAAQMKAADLNVDRPAQVDETLKTPITAVEEEALQEEGLSIVKGTHNPDDHELDRFHDDGGPHPPEVAALVPVALASEVETAAQALRDAAAAPVGGILDSGAPIPMISFTASPTSGNAGPLPITSLPGYPVATFPLVDASAKGAITPPVAQVDYVTKETLPQLWPEAAPATTLEDRVAELEATVADFRKIMDHHGLRGPQN